LASNQDQYDNKILAMPLIISVVEEVIQREKLPNNSIHVLEKISEITETQEAETTAASQTSFTDVMELEAHTQTNTTENSITDDMNVEIMQEANAPVRVAPIQHQEIPVSKNVQSDLDLWAHIREYDQRIAAEGFTQVLSKKQQQAMKKQVLGKATYNTREKGTPPSSSS